MTLAKVAVGKHKRDSGAWPHGLVQNLCGLYAIVDRVKRQAAIGHTG
jgi:hypothetical protein